MNNFELYDVVVIGAGPGGMAAGITVSERGGRVLLIDRGCTSGGQVYRKSQISGYVVFNKGSSDRTAGENIRKRLIASSVETSFNSTVWKVTPDRRVFMIGPEGPRRVVAGALIVATGARERIVPFEGWTLPGVMGLGAAINLVKADMATPDGRIVLAGSGPLLYSSAWQIMQLGGNLAAIADLSGPTDWLRKIPAMLNRSDLLWQGVKWMAAVKRKGIPVYHGHTVVSARGEDHVRQVNLAHIHRLKSGKATPLKTIASDYLCVGHGLHPNTEITRLIGARHQYVPEMGGWISVRDDKGRTTVTNVFATGDAAGIRGAWVSELEGVQVGMNVSDMLGLKTDGNFRPNPMSGSTTMKRALRFGKAGAMLMIPPLELLDVIGPDTPVCRCEEVTRSEIEKAGKEIPDLNYVKRVTRCGMGPCQGRYCEETLGLLLSRCSGKPIAELGCFKPRDPLFPIEISTIIGNADYEEIAFPAPLPG